jgi:hypothetical protein
MSGKMHIDEFIAMGKAVAGRRLSVKQASIEYGVHQRRVDEARRVASASDAVVQALRAGGLTRNMALTLSEYPLEGQPELVRKVLEASARGARRPLLVAMGEAKVRRSPTRAIEQRMNSCLDQLENASDMLSEFLAEPRTRDHEGRAGWLKRVRGARRTLNTILEEEREEKRNGSANSIVREGPPRVHQAVGPGGPPENPEEPPSVVGEQDRGRL